MSPDDAHRPAGSVRRRLVAGAALSGAAAAGWLMWKRGQRRRLEDLPPAVATSPIVRGARVGGTITRAATGWTIDQARSVFADAARREELSTARQLRTAEQVADLLGEMRGAMMKLGQMASHIDQGLPPAMRDVLARLQHDAVPMAPELAAQVIETELGGPPSTVFLEWDPVPIAAASIGQVHRAITHEGRPVAVKVQYPGIDEAIRSDLDSAFLLMMGMRAMMPGLDTSTLHAELRERILEELDYRLEAANQQLFADAYRGHPTIHVPEVHHHLSTSRVLTTDLAVGARLSDARSWSADERNRAGETIYRFVFRSLYDLHAFNGDPHPGNYLFRPGGHVTFLDFGMVKRFTDDEFRTFEDMTKAMAYDHDIARFRSIIEEVGFIEPGLDLDDEAIKSYFGHFYELVEEDRVVTIDADYASGSVRRLLDPTGPTGDVLRVANLPRHMIIVQRINLGLHGVLAELEATANWRRIGEEIWPWTRSAPTTDVGRAEQEWLQRGSRP